MSIRIPPYLDDVTPFQAVEVFQAARALEAEGRDIVHLEFGEPDFPTPEVVTEAAVRAMRGGQTHYTHSLGLPALREAICAYHNAKYGLALEPEQVVVSMGTSILTYLLLMMLLEPGDEVILTDPTYACYANFVRLARGVPVSVRIREADGFQVDPEAVRAAMTPRTRAVMVCSPANPTGVLLKPEVLRELGTLGVPVISDEIYHGLAYGAAEQSVLQYADEAFVLNGYSKYFAMTGWRLGYLIYPKALMRTVMKVHQNVMISAAEPIQHAGIAAMTEAVEVCEGYRREYDRRRVFLLERLGQIGLPLKYEPAGAFYAFADASAYGRDSLALSMDILREAGVALTPGIDFGEGGEGYLRFSYANSLENIAEAMNRLERYLAARRNG